MLVDGPANLVAAQRRDHPLDMPPVTEAGNIAVIPAPLGAHRSFQRRIVPEAVDEVGSVGERNAAVDEGSVHALDYIAAPFRDCGQSSSTGR